MQGGATGWPQNYTIGYSEIVKEKQKVRCSGLRQDWENLRKCTDYVLYRCQISLRNTGYYIPPLKSFQCLSAH